MSDALRGRRVVITGGSGALGSAVTKAFVDAGAICEVTTRKSEPSTSDRIRYHVVDAADENAVARFYAALGKVWASVHLVGAFEMSPVADTSLESFRKMF